jgi:hypothetical protein
MKKLLFFLLGCISCIGLSFYQNKTTVEAVDALALFKENFVGEFDNFQQCWQENTKTDNHRITIEHKHKHFHSAMRVTDMPNVYTITHYNGDDTTKIMGQRSVKITQGTGANELIMTIFDQKDPSKVFETVKWQLKDGKFEGKQDNSSNIWQLSKEGFFVLNDKSFSNASNVPYRLLKCRFFKGWIELPMDNVKKDSVYHYANLRIHDQGGHAQLKMPDGKLVNYSVELTQLIFGKNLPIMKLAVYEMPENQLEYNSHSISYTWTNPEAKRLGINLRKLISGWTLDDASMWNSDSKK